MADYTPGDDLISGIISEFSDVIAFSRTRWTRYAEEVDSGLSAIGLLVLQFIIRKGPVTATELSHMLDMDKSLVSRQVAKLRELEFIETTEAEDDRRVQLITGSTKAVALIGHIRTRWANSYREHFETWSDAELETLRTGLHRFNVSAGDARSEGSVTRGVRQANEEHPKHNAN